MIEFIEILAIIILLPAALITAAVLIYAVLNLLFFGVLKLRETAKLFLDVEHFQGKGS